MIEFVTFRVRDIISHISVGYVMKGDRLSESSDALLCHICISTSRGEETRGGLGF